MAPILACILVCLLYLSPLAKSQSSPPPQQQPPCNYSSQACGGLQIPYPFGMSDECGLPQYRIVCKSNASYGDGDLPFLQIGTDPTPEMQVLSFQTNQLIVNSTGLKAMPSPQQDCIGLGTASLELHRGGPFILSDNNWFAVVGCESNGACKAVMNDSNTTIFCNTSCYNQFFMPFCNYYACCINPFPPSSWMIDFEGGGISYESFPNVCGFSTVLNPATYNISAEELGQFAAGRYGLSISWALVQLNGEEDCSMISQRADYACDQKASCNYDKPLLGYTCNCANGYRGDGYKSGIGCQDINECEEKLDDCEDPPLGRCTNTEGSYNCSCVAGGGSGRPGTCPLLKQPSNILKPALIGGLVGAVVLAVILEVVGFFWIAYMKRMKRRENFHRAGGDQLQSYLFSERELATATNSFSKSHVIGEGGFGEVYWGYLSIQGVKRKVAIKKAKPKAVDEQMAQMQSFVKEILLLSKTGHRSVVLLLGCCVETSVPLLVYEYVEKGDLTDYLKPQGKHCRGILLRSRHTSLWAWRLHVAVETAEALSYLHDREEPIFHLDLKPQNILIDNNYNPKVADFGLSCFLASNATHLSIPLVAGTAGYVDPEYGYTYRITNKFDVYSFGVILLELISSLPPFGSDGSLSHHFCTNVNMREEIVKHSNHLKGFIDGRLESDAEVVASINEVADVARRCVALRGSDRPSMQEVHLLLKQAQAKHLGCNPKLSGSGSGHGSTEKKLFSFASFEASNNHTSQYLPLAYAEDWSNRSAVSTYSLLTTQDSMRMSDTTPEGQTEFIELQPFSSLIIR